MLKRKSPVDDIPPPKRPCRKVVGPNKAYKNGSYYFQFQNILFFLNVSPPVIEYFKFHKYSIYNYYFSGKCASCRMQMYIGESGSCYRCLILPKCVHCRRHRQPSAMDGNWCIYCVRQRKWVVERKEAKRSLNGVFAINSFSADTPSDDQTDLDTYLQQRRSNIRSCLQTALINQK